MKAHESLREALEEEVAGEAVEEVVVAVAEEEDAVEEEVVPQDVTKAVSIYIFNESWIVQHIYSVNFSLKLYL